MEHSIDIELAQEVGINAAIIYKNIYHWCLKNKANDKNIFDNNWWTYNSIKAFKELFAYLSEKQIRTALKKLEELNYISIGNYNKSAYDRTQWYAISNLPKGKMELTKSENGNVEKGEPIPNVNTYIKPNNKKKDTKKEFDINKYEDFIQILKRKVKIKSKITQTNEGKDLFNAIEDKQKLIDDYIFHQDAKGDFAQRITAYMLDYDPNAMNDIIF